MAKYKVEFKPSVWKDLDPIPIADRRRILKKIDSLQHNSRPWAAESSPDKKDIGSGRVTTGSYIVSKTIGW